MVAVVCAVYAQVTSDLRHVDYKLQLPATLDVQYCVEVSFELVQACLVHPSNAFWHLVLPG